MTVNKDLYMLSFPPDLTGRRPATPVLMQYATPDQWAAQNPELAERQRSKAAALFAPPSARSPTNRFDAPATGSSERQNRAQRATVWYCSTPGCEYPGPYPIELYADCVLGCQEPRQPSHRIDVLGRTEPQK